MEPLAAGDTVRLVKGSIIKFVAAMPSYKVTEADTQSNPPTLILHRQPAAVSEEEAEPLCPPIIKLECVGGKKMFSIGRLEGHDVTLSGIGDVSRNHGTIQCTSKGFIYQHMAKNPGYAEKAALTRPDDHSTVKTVNLEIHSDEEKDPELFIPLYSGTSFSFHNTAPAYRARITNNGHHTLRLERENGGDGDKRYPRVIEVSDKAITIGRTSDNDVILLNNAISNRQGTIGWSEEDQSFIYHCTGKSVPVIHASNAFIEEQKELCAKLQPASGDEAKAQLKHVDGLMGKITRYQKQLEDVKDLECSVINHWGALHGGKTEDSQIGYALWLESLAALYNETLSDEQKRGIAKMVGVIRQLADDRAALRDIETKHIPDYDPRSCNRFPYAILIYPYVQRKIEALERDGEAYMVSGFKGHHAISRIRKEGNGYRMTTYNAGAEALPAPGDDGKVMGVYEQEVRGDVKELIRVLAEKKIRQVWRQDYDAIYKAAEKCLNPNIVRYKAVAPQQRGNCTTRSTRHALEDALGEELMRKISRHVADPEISAAEDLKAALVLRKKRLQEWCRGQGIPVNDAAEIPTSPGARIERAGPQSDGSFILG